MTIWRRVPGADNLYVSIAVRPIDDFTGQTPSQRIFLALDQQSGARWIPLEIEPVYTASGVIAFTGLAKVADPAASPVQRYRVRVVDPEQLGLYHAAYQYSLDGLEFDVSPWNDSAPPANLPNTPETVFLWPGPNYRFPASVPILRGRTVDAAAAPLQDARVTAGTDHVLSDERGTFSLPIRLTTPAPSVMVVAEHARSGTSVSTQVSLPAGLLQGIELQLV